ncbi:aromatic ring-hydroxylating oxygenase subunit alpha [Sphingomicrobium lutaoense]|uniref:Phenylpropionate dioxygenase-like ring-hydroxylating dioxygenase large terminal subunit n=1 Tax=Sphingomicrobium lutaoense TaxID=515949 RepID=A0A839Z290_9SPHN|nr:aromatic ring-hydroxylating dioxygenase subunit alpha [Sphingomicrobium lutaoense]MBB3764157.1 phenylpropionate dioxygenase-like ring-hydroxylating dioxygenase large terminal subunit [Sphingomicrobium lutaoense]
MCMAVPKPARHPTEGQVALAEALARGETWQGEEIHRLSTARYTDQARHELERELIFGKRPVPLIPSALLPHPDMAVAHDDYRRPLVITRDSEGEVHVLANSCAHRGTRLVDERRPIPARKIVCPYHAWVYRSDGSLAGLPRQDSFPGLCKDDHNLVRYAAHECGDIIWGAFGKDPDFSRLDALCEDLEALGLGDMALYKRRTHRVKANWKMVMDAFLESYHVKRLHQDTIAEYFADAVATGDVMGDHQRFAVGRTEYAAQVDTSDWQQVREVATFTYQIFPNGVLVVSPDYANLLVVMPGRKVNRCRVENFMLVPGDADPGEFAPRWEKSWRLLDEGTFGKEDFGAAALCQAGVDGGVQTEMLVGTLEAGMTRFHDLIDREIGIQASE